MESTELTTLKFPIGKYERNNDPSKETLTEWINVIAELPEQIKELTLGLSSTQIKWVYRPDGWTIQQVVHHLADSHMNSFIRFKLALTEDTPTIKPYHEDRWAKLPDAIEVEIDASLDILKGVHQRWSVLLQSLKEEQLTRTLIHPEHVKKLTIKEMIGLYAWHSNHHRAHINQALKFKGTR
jgi:hypothetical protein